MTKSEKVAEEIGGQMVSGAFWMIAMRWAIRLIGLASTMILVRVLTPEDFGIMAMALLCVGLTSSFIDFSVDQAILREPVVTPEHYDSGWVIQILIGTISAGAIVLMAPAVAWYFDEPRVQGVLFILALQSLIGGFENIGVVQFRRDLDFGREFTFWTLKKLFSVAASISLAFYFRNFYALAVALVVGTIASVSLSYIMSPYRPRISTAKVAGLWSFSRWMVITNGAQYGSQKADGLAVGRWGGAEQLGLYSVSAEVSFMPIQEIFMPLDRALLPTYARLQSSPSALNEMFRSVMALSWMGIIPVTVGLILVAEDLVRVILGPKWESAVLTFQWLAFAGGCLGMILVLKDMMTTMRLERRFALMQISQLGVLIGGSVILAAVFGTGAIAPGRAAVSGVFAILMMVQVLALLGVGLWDAVRMFWRPCLSAAGMALAVMSLHHTFFELPLLSLTLDILVGGATFVLLQIALWIVCGRPSGPEGNVLNWLKNSSHR